MNAALRGVMVLCCCTAASSGFAQPAEAPGVTTTVDPCVPIDAEQFQRVLGIELGTSTDYRQSAPTEPGLTWVHVSCAAAGGIELRLEDGITRKSMVRVLDTSGIEDASRTRLLALAVAEFVVASWVELRINEQPRVPAVGAAPNPQARRSAETVIARRVPGARAAAAAEPETTWNLGALFRLEAWSSLETVVPTVGLRLGQHPYGHLTFSLGLDLGFAREAVGAGQVDLMLASATGVLLFVTRAAALDLYAGGGGRFGFVRMAGLPRDQDAREGLSFVAPYGGLLLLARVAYRVSHTLRLIAEAEAGLITLRAKGLEQRVVLVGLEGSSISLGAGIGWAF